MKYVKLSASVFFLIMFLQGCQQDKSVSLFNGKDLADWELYVDGDVDPESLFFVEDGVVNVAGIPNGYMRTKDTYSNYSLHVEWRWTESPGNSGILFHATGENKFWPNSIECQLQSGSAGLIILVGAGAGLTQNDSTYLVIPDVTGNIWVSKFQESSEHPAGEWNVAEIVTSSEGDLEITVNGVLQNKATDLMNTEGSILLQSEGAPMQFRNIILTPL